MGALEVPVRLVPALAVTGGSRGIRGVTEPKQLGAEREQQLAIAERMVAEARASSRSRDEFLAMLGHELRNSLSPVRNAVACVRLDSRQSERALDIAWRQTKQLDRLVDQVRVARDGPTALELACADVPELMLVDIGLPGMDGCEVARRARRTPELRGVVLVAFTGYGYEEDHRRTLGAGFDHHLTKPVDPAVVRELLRSHGTARP